MRVSPTLGLALALPLSIACASAPPATPPVEAPTAPAPSATPPAPSAAAPPSTIPEGPRTVRCGVDDHPVDVASPTTQEPPQRSSEDTALEDIAKARVGASPARQQELARAQMQAILRQGSVATNAPLDPGRGAFAIERVSRDGRPVDAATLRLRDGQTPPKTVDVSSCKLGKAAPGREIALDVQVSASGAPVTAIAQGEGLDDAQARCLGAIGCHLSLANTTEAALLSVKGPYTFTPPSLDPDVSVSARHVSRVEKVPPRVLAPWEAALLPLTKACAREHPPLGPFTTSFDVRIDESGHVGLPRGPTADAAGAIIACLAPQLAALEPSMRKVPRGSLVTTTLGFSFEVKFPKVPIDRDAPSMRPRH